MGPLTMARQLERVQGYIAKGVAEGATLVTGGGRPRSCRTGTSSSRRCSTTSTVEHDDRAGGDLRARRLVHRYDDVDDAVAKANDTIYGLHGAVYTADPERGYEVARRVRSGSVTVNGMIVDFKMPFGGFKQSGIGREGGIEGLDPYFEVKTVYFG